MFSYSGVRVSRLKKSISGIDALSSALVIITLIWLQFFGLKRSKTVSWILIGSGILSSFIGLVAACMYSVGLKYTKGQSESYFDLVLITSGANKGVAIEVGATASWVAFISWTVYSIIEITGYKYYDSIFF